MAIYHTKFITHAVVYPLTLLPHTNTVIRYSTNSQLQQIIRHRTTEVYRIRQNLRRNNNSEHSIKNTIAIQNQNQIDEYSIPTTTFLFRIGTTGRIAGFFFCDITVTYKQYLTKQHLLQNLKRKIKIIYPPHQ